MRTRVKERITNQERKMSDNIEGDGGNEFGGASSSGKKHARYTSDQVKVMEDFFKVNQLPEEEDREELSSKLGLTPLQVKFWFQNRRTQMKVQQERTDNANLRLEIEKLQAEIVTLKKTISSMKCLTCGEPYALQKIILEREHLAQKNERLTKENIRLQTVAELFIRKITLSEGIAEESQSQFISSSHHEVGSSSVQVQNQFVLPTLATVDESSASEAHVEKAIGEFSCLIRAEEPVWTNKHFMDDPINIFMNANELRRLIPQEMLLSNNMKREGSKHTSIVSMRGEELFRVFMDVNKWKDTFSLIVTKAETLKILPQRNGLQLMQIYAELQVLSPLVPTRHTSFFRLCQQPQNGLWIVVDFSLEKMDQRGWYHKFPSGCVILDIPGGRSQVTWIEQGEREDIVHEFKSEMAFGAQHWLTCLQRKCEWYKHLTDLASQGDGTFLKRNMINLAQNVSNQFVANMSALSRSRNDHPIKITTRKASELGIQSHGVVICVGTSIKLLVAPKLLFDHLRNENFTSELRILLTGVWRELVRIPDIQDTSNCISFFEISNDGKQEFWLKQSFRDASGSFCAYACTGRDALYRSDASLLPIASCFGFAVFPCHNNNNAVPVPVSNPRGTLHNAASATSSTHSESSVLTITFQEIEKITSHCNLSPEYVAKLHEIMNSNVRKVLKYPGFQCL